MKILIIKTSALGDILHTLPAVRFIQEVVPDAEIEWVVEKSCQDLIQYPKHVIDTKKWRKTWALKEIREVVQVLRKKTFDVVFDFQGNTKSGMILGLIKAKLKVGFGKKSVSEWPNLLFTDFQVDPEENLNIRQDYLALVEAWAGKKASLPVVIEKKIPFSHILVCPGSKWKNKRLRQETLLQFLLSIPCQFSILYCSLEEKKVAETLQSKLPSAAIIGNLSILELKEKMQQMDAVIAMDSFPLHLAAELNIPTFSIFGPSLANKYQPIGHHSIQGKCPYGRIFKKRCPILRTCPTGACMHFEANQIIKLFYL